jgi:hypothetical protein
MQPKKVNIVGYLNFNWDKIQVRYGNSSLHDKLHYVDPLTSALDLVHQCGPVKDCVANLVVANDSIFEEGKYKVVPFHRSSEVATPGQIDVITFSSSPFTVGFIDDEGDYVYRRVNLADQELRIPSHRWRCLLFFEPANLDYIISARSGNLLWEEGVGHFLQNE